MNLSTSKNLGGVGALLIFIGFLAAFVPYGGVLSLIGVILLLIGMKGLADYYQTGGIFNNALYALIAAIVGVVVAVGVAFVAFIAVLNDLGITLANLTDATTISNELVTQLMNIGTDTFFTIIGAVIAVALILFIFAIIAAFLYRRSLGLLSSKTGVGLFGTAGILILVGAVLIIIAIGVFLIWIGFLLAAIAFFQIKTQPAQPAPAPPPQ